MSNIVNPHFIRGQFVVNCSCNDPSHMLHFYYNEEDNDLIVTTVLRTEKNIFKRIWIALKYIFGYKRLMCEFSDTLLEENKIKELENLLSQAKHYEEHYEE